MKSLLWLSTVRATDRPLLGGKAAMLGEMLAAGFRVPNGFVVLEAASDEECLAAFDQLGAARVAVRSSAIAEDGQKQSWAGALETFLPVDRALLIEKIAACRASGQAKRAQAYGEAGRVAVIIQTMVKSEVSGVLFSVDPVSNDADLLLIEGSRGLGEAVVSGSVIPEHIVVSKKTGAIVEKQNHGPSVLTDAMVAELAVMARKVERLLGAPVDIEWTYAEGKLYLLQARPITTL